MFYGIDDLYIILVLPAIIFALLAQWRVKSTFKKFSTVVTRRSMTGAQVADAVLRAGGTRAAIQHVAGKLNDHYDPKTNVIRLSDEVYGSTSVAAVGVAAHEAGHALQYAEGYGPIKLRAAIIPVTQIGSKLAFPLVLLGIVLSFPPLYMIGIICFSLVTFFQLVTLPVEFNASRRALAALESTHILDEDENRYAKKVLSAAAMTYLAALAVSLAQLLRLLAMGRRRR